MALDPFGDLATQGYLRNVAGALDPERVKCLEHRSFDANVLTALHNLETELDEPDLLTSPGRAEPGIPRSLALDPPSEAAVSRVSRLVSGETNGRDR